LLRFEKICVKASEKELVNIAFDVESSLAIVGESGSGKSLTLKAIMGILPKELECEMVFDGVNSLKRGKDIAFVPQNPFTALSPMSKIKRQFWGVSKELAVELMSEMGLDAELMNRFPSELSGGELQRVIIALSLSQNPKLLLMDEPTTALDVDTKHDIVRLIKDLQKKKGFYLIFVTHELYLARELCDKIMVIREGKSIESGRSKELFLNPKSSYTKRLIEADFNGREFRK
jgi:peptide/nickel transport system ATP-binding protein